MQDRIKEHDRDIWLACTETSAVSEYAYNTEHKPLWNEVKSIDRDPREQITEWTAGSKCINQSFWKSN